VILQKLVIDKNNKPIFLEVNPTGDLAFIKDTTGYPLLKQYPIQSQEKRQQYNHPFQSFGETSVEKLNFYCIQTHDYNGYYTV
jgi:hypothetical protein